MSGVCKSAWRSFGSYLALMVGVLLQISPNAFRHRLRLSCVGTLSKPCQGTVHCVRRICLAQEGNPESTPSIKKSGTNLNGLIQTGPEKGSTPTRLVTWLTVALLAWRR